MYYFSYPDGENCLLFLIFNVETTETTKITKRLLHGLVMMVLYHSRCSRSFWARFYLKMELTLMSKVSCFTSVNLGGNPECELFAKNHSDSLPSWDNLQVSRILTNCNCENG